MNDHANRDIKSVVITNPCNTLTMVLRDNCPDLLSENFHALTRLDHNRGLSQIAYQYNCLTSDVEQFCVWGNHAPSMVPDITNVKVKGEKIFENIDPQWLEFFIPRVKNRAIEIVKSRGSQSCASAGNSSIDHFRDWVFGSGGKWVSKGVTSDGSYGISEGLISSFPCTVDDRGNVEIVKGLELSEQILEMIRETNRDLEMERDMVINFLRK